MCVGGGKRVLNSVVNSYEQIINVKCVGQSNFASLKIKDMAIGLGKSAYITRIGTCTSLYLDTDRTPLALNPTVSL